MRWEVVLNIKDNNEWGSFYLHSVMLFSINKEKYLMNEIKETNIEGMEALKKPTLINSNWNKN